MAVRYLGMVDMRGYGYDKGDVVDSVWVRNRMVWIVSGSGGGAERSVGA